MTAALGPWHTMGMNTKKRRLTAHAAEGASGSLATRASPPFSRVGIRAPKLSHLVAERLRAMIATGELRPGDTLPPEAELLRQFNVSRPIMREALRVLEAESLIRLGRGARAGAMVLTPSILTAAKYGGLYLATQGTTLGEIHQVRTLLEPPLTALLASRAKKEFVKELEECASAQHDALNRKDYAAAIAAVNQFHHSMVANSENSALKLLAGMLNDISAAAYPRLLLSRPNQKVIWERTEDSIAAHGQILKLISAGKASQAELFWRKYMQETADFLVKNGLANLPVDIPRSAE
jgi:DNA-binding FadR family transcriptional regulator